MGRDADNPIVAKLYKGQPTVKIELEFDQKTIDNKLLEGPISISLESLDVDLHNQSYGLVQASTGCMSNPGGPGC
jgi:hypothetical protein